MAFDLLPSALIRRRGATLGLAVLGVQRACGWVLALLLAWPEMAAAAVPPSPDGPPASGLSILSGHPANVHMAPSLATDVSIDVSGVLARVRVRQRFKNPRQSWAEGLYTFPLPDNAAVDRLRMRIGERLVEGEIREKQAADEEYRAARSRGQVASLVKQHRPNVFMTAVANIPPREAVEVEIVYQQRLTWRAGRFVLRFPTVVAPRYIPGQVRRPDRPGGVGHGTGWAADTDEVPDASAITPPVASGGAVDIHRLVLEARVDAGFPLKAVRSLHHAAEVHSMGPGRFRLQLSEPSAAADRDFVLEWQPAPDHRPRLAAFGEQWAGRHYSMVVLMPPSDETETERLERELVLLIDSSGSMHGASLAQAKRAVGQALEKLRPGDRFNLIGFNDRVEVLFDQAQPVSPDALADARRFLSMLVAEGGTEMRPALSRAFDNPADTRLLRQVVFLTDGAVGNERMLFELIERERADSRLFTVGIGSAPNAYFMRRAARFGRGTYTFIGNADDVDSRVRELFDSLRRPMLTDLSVDWALPSGTAPAEQAVTALPDLYAGHPLVVSAVSDAPPGAVTVRGRGGAQPWMEKRRLRFGANAPGLHVLWARRRITDWLDARVSGIDGEQIRKAVVQLGLMHHLVTPHTSLVAVDKTPRRPAAAALERGIVPTLLPAGWSPGHVFGQLPATATPGPLIAFGGVVLLTTALGLWLFPATRCDSGDA